MKCHFLFNKLVTGSAGARHSSCKAAGYWNRIIRKRRKSEKMKCSNCGTDLSEGTRFCEVCGQKVEEVVQPTQQEVSKETVQQEVAQETVQTEAEQFTEAVSSQSERQSEGDTEQQPTWQSENPQEPQKPKKKLGFKIGIAAIIIVVLAVGVVAGAKVYKAVKKAMMSPTEYYQYVETKNRDENQKAFVDYYDVLYSNMAADNANKNLDMKFRISDTAKSLLSLSGIDFSKINDIEMDMTSSKDGNAYSTLGYFKLNDESLLTLKMYIDVDNNELYFQVPELTESYLDGSNAMKEMASLDGENNLFGLSGSLAMYQPGEYLPDTSDLDAIITRYTDIAIENAKDVKKAEKEVEAEGVSQKVTEYSVTLNAKDGIKICEDILKEAKDDKNIKNILDKGSSDVYSSFQSGIEDALDELENSEKEDQDVFTMKTYVDSDDSIIGRELEIKEGAIVIKAICPRDGEKFGYEFSVAENDITYVTVTGSGTEKSSVVNGDFIVGVDESVISDMQLASSDQLLKIKVEDYDASNISKGESSGTITISTDAVAQLANYSIKIKSEGNMETAKETVSIMAGQDELAAIDISVDNADPLEDIKPSNNDTIYDASDESDMTAYGSEIAIEDFLTKLQDKTGIDLSSLMGLPDQDDYESYDDYNDLTY